jgi:hypothetical protein
LDFRRRRDDRVGLSDSVALYLIFFQLVCKVFFSYVVELLVSK